MTIKELKQKGYNTITSLKKIDKSIRIEKIPSYIRINGIKIGNATYYPKEILDKVLDYFFNVPKEEKTKIINKERYGVENQFQRKEFIKESMKKKYGVDHPSKSRAIREKVKNTLLERYGIENPSQLEEFKNKMIESNKRNHNGLFNSQTKDYLEKRAKTWKEKYGVENISQIGLNKTKKINFDKIWFDSKWEVYYYFYLKNNNIPFEYHPTKLSYIFEEKEHFYLPDFKVYDRFVEIKGDYFFKDGKMINPYNKTLNEKYQAKFDCMKMNNVLILTWEDIIPFKKYYDNNHL